MTLREQSADLGNFLIDTLQKMQTMVTAGAERREVTRFSRLNDAFIATLMGLQRTHYLAGGLPSLVIGAGTTTVFLYDGWRVMQNTMTLDTLAAFIAYQSRVVAPMQTLIKLYGAFATARVSWRQVAALLDATPNVIERPDAFFPATIQNDVEFESVSLSHGRRPVLDMVSFHAKPSTTVALIGSNGSGKSTIADLAMRLLDPDSDVVRLDRHDLKSLRLADLRRAVHAIKQEPLLFHGTIDDNVRYARPETNKPEIAAALNAADLASFVAKLPENRRTIVGSRGLLLSTGERQRVAIARAFVANPSVLILDEPSAALDPVAERQIIDGYHQIMQGRTTILISHRLELVRSAEQMFVLDDARVVEDDTPAELQAQGDAFARLFGEPATFSRHADEFQPR